LGDVPLVPLDDFRAHVLIGTYHVSVVFRIELAGEARGIHHVTEQHGELTSLSLLRWRSDRKGRFDLRRWLFLGSRRLCRLSKMRGDFLSACIFASPDETSTILIDHRMCEKQFVLQVFEVVIVEVKSSLEGTIRYTSLVFQ
jgi:hypothetical protein